ncbi:tyrosinase 2 [Beauveria bassiana ARSEF 2860]|uniref:Tyrosinase 2 n=1 Tax=Beauveria bassiana (strain ARSEF 2860) TaxID=655819 RepID=J5JNM7_BEAB2|nr:tyrosinase 2 [Beauveria bassiana ARSEF 2860]EJP66768.1 tyrosinase 2 [Beauveria bassiana ARSEF 2860]
MRLQLRAASLFLTLASTVLASSFVSSTEGVAGAIVGALGGVDGRIGDNGPIPLRRSITELAAEAGPQWDLYLQALRAMYDRDSKDPESFFQIAGIHGRPFTEYNNAGKMNTNGWGGYSTHGEILFIIWHRPFVALFEQTLVKEAKILAAQYPDNLRSIYQRAAEDLRAPYWDWALEPWLPSVVLPETIEVKAATKTGTVAKKIENPLYTYRFSKEVMQGKYGEFDTYDRMYRCQNPQDANQKLYSRNYKSWVYDVFSRAKSFSEFATTASKGSSIEAVHNAIHWDAGCGGQFMDSQYAAFEPLFMLHHSNVDRLWAYWQAIYPEASTFNGRYQCLSRFNTLSGTMTSLDSPLQPFRQANGEWHTSRSVNSIKTFGYAYQGLEYWTKSETEMQQGAVELINSLYGPEEKKKKRPSVSSTSAKSTQTSSKQSVQMSSSKQSIQTTSTESTQTTIKQSSQTTLTQSTQTSSSKKSSQSTSEHSTQSASQQSTPTTIEQSSQSTLTQSTQSISSKQSTQSASEQSSQLASKQSTQSSAQASSQPAPTISSSSSSSSSHSTETISKQSTQASGTVSTGTSKQQSKETSSVQSTTQSSGTVSTDNQHSIETSSVQSTQSHIEQTSSSVLSSPSQSTATAGNRTSSAWPTAGASKPSSPISSSSRAGNETSVAPSATSAALPTTSAQVDAQSDSNATKSGDNKRFYAGITVDVAYLPVRPCAIEISIDMWRAGDMAIMQMPEKGIVYDSISLSDAISNAGLGDVSDTEVVSQVMSRLHVALRKADGSSIDVTQLSGLRVDIEEAEVVTATSKFELSQMVKSSTHVMLDKPVSGCAAQY